jgi:dihydroorotate dehydrogenase (NAD+) catalytic subunit
MLNGIGIQNPGIERWSAEIAPRLTGLEVDIWGSAVAEDPPGFGIVAKGLVTCGVSAVEVNLSCPNLESGEMFSFDPVASGLVIEAVTSSVEVPVGAKLSPNTPDIVAVARHCIAAGASFLVLTNTALGFGIDLRHRRPHLSGGVGGYSGPGLKPISLRCVYEVAKALPGAPIVGCGGVTTGEDVVEYLLAGASAVELGTVHLAEPRAGSRIERELVRWMQRRGITSPSELVGKVEEW